MRAYRREGDPGNVMRCKFYARGDILALSATVPILEKMGLFVDSEVNFELQLKAAPLHPAERVFIHDIETRSADGKPIDLGTAGQKFEDAFTAIWTARAESDGFNRLILTLPCTWREAALIRALARYRQQTGLDPSQAIQEQALAANPKIAALILAIFRARFDPNLPESMDTRRIRSQRLEIMLDAALNEVVSLDDDRALRRIAQLVTAIRSLSTRSSIARWTITSARSRPTTSASTVGSWPRIAPSWPNSNRRPPPNATRRPGLRCRRRSMSAHTATPGTAT